MNKDIPEATLELHLACCDPNDTSYLSSEILEDDFFEKHDLKLGDKVQYRIDSKTNDRTFAVFKLSEEDNAFLISSSTDETPIVSIVDTLNQWLSLLLKHVVERNCNRHF